MVPAVFWPSVTFTSRVQTIARPGAKELGVVMFAPKSMLVEVPLIWHDLAQNGMGLAAELCSTAEKSKIAGEGMALTPFVSVTV